VTRRRATARKRLPAAARTAAAAVELQMLAPLVMTTRLSGLRGATPMQALFEWNRWAMEKSFAFSAAGMAWMQASTRMAMTGLGRGTKAATPLQAMQQASMTAGKVLAPLHKRVRRNAARSNGLTRGVLSHTRTLAPATR